MSFTVFLGNLPAWVTKDDIKSWLNAENLVYDDVKVIRNPETQESKGFAFIDTPNAEEMNSIIRRFDRAPLEDRLLRANQAQPPKSKGPGVGPSGPVNRATAGPGPRRERGGRKHMRPFDLPEYYAAAAGLVFGIVIVIFEIQVRKTTLKRLFGAAFGSLLGIIGAYLISLILGRALPGNSSTIAFVQLLLLLWMGYVGLAVGASKGEMLNLGALGGLFGGEQTSSQSFKILDTSVIIDGRIADIVETGFLDGTLVIPQFVLRELQLVADSADSLKRNRGRRGLDVLQRVQKMTQLNIQILEDDFPNVHEVDMKLIELAKVYSCKIVTNDFNLNKVAQLHGVQVLNINELANALKPVVLPGEIMRVFILK